jgi:hypothetical protein
MSKKKDNQEVNEDQSAKSRRGKAFENMASEIYKNLANDINNRFGKKVVYYLGHQPEFWATRFNDDGEKATSHAKFDHSLAVHDEERNRVMIIMTDETTTCRGERMRTKSHQGISHMRVADEIESKTIEMIPVFSECEFVHCNALVFPDQITGVKHPDVEEDYLKTFCIKVNYKTNDFASTDECPMVDIATKIGDFCNVVTILATHLNGYDWNKNTLPIIWKEQHVGFDWMPFVELTKEQVLRSKDRVLYWLNNDPDRYTKEKLFAFFKEHGIKIRKSTLKPILLQLAKDLIDENYE